jgi:hypothetical protein
MVDGELHDTKFDCKVKREKQIVLHSNRTGRAPFIGDGWLLIIVSFAHPNLFNKRFAPPSAFYPLLWLPPSSSPSQVWPATLGRFYKEEAPWPRPRPSSSVLSVAPAKRVRFRSDEEESSQCTAPVRLPRRSMEEAGSLSARGKKPYTRARAKLADSSDDRMER